MARAALAFLLLLLSAFFCALSYSFSLSTFYNQIALAGLGFVLPFVGFELAFFSLGLSLCLFPIFGKYACSLFLCLWLLGFQLKGLFARERMRGPERDWTLAAIACLVLSCYFGSLFITAVRQSDLQILRDIASHGSLLSLLEFVSAESAVLKAALAEICSLIAMLLLIRFVRTAALKQGYSRVCASLFMGVSCGVLFASLFTFAQLYELHPFFVEKRGVFWKQVGRYSGSFSDPNAFGVIGSLLVPVLLFSGLKGAKRVFVLSSALIFCVFLPWSGSRTLWLAAGLWLLYIFAAKLMRLSFFRRVAFSLLLLGGLSIVFTVLSHPSTNKKLQHFSSSPGVLRLLKTFSAEEYSDMFASRELYTKLATQLWLVEPRYGHGLASFYFVQKSAADDLGIELSGWRDSASSFYLEVLAEQGLLGFAGIMLAVLLFFSGSSPEKNHGERRCERILELAIGVFTLTLLTGPHLDFEEVRYTLAILLGLLSSKTPPKSMPQSKQALVFVISGGIILSFAFVAWETYDHKIQTGFYGYETGEEGKRYRWSASRSKISICAPANEQVVLKYRAHRPDVNLQSPLEVEFFYDKDGQLFEKAVLTSTNWQTLSLPSSFSGGGPRALGIRVNSLWSPSGASQGDKRLLGIVLEWPERVCD